MVHVARHEDLVVRGAHRALLIRWAMKGRTKQAYGRMDPFCMRGAHRAFVIRWATIGLTKLRYVGWA